MIKTSYILVAMAIFLIIALPNVSAADWDNVKSYEAISKTVTIKDSFLGIPMGDVATVKLLSPTPIYVNTGWQQIADMEVDNTKEERTMNDILGAITFKDMKSGKMVTREVQYKVFEKNGTRTFTEYEANCHPEKGESCKVIALHYEDTGNWVNIKADKKLKKGQERIGIFVNVQKNDYVDYVPTMYGVSINEWAVYINLVVNAHAQAPTTSNGASDPEGMRIIANLNKSLAAIRLYDDTVDAPYCYVGYQSLGCANGYLTPLGNFTVDLTTRYANITAGVVNLTKGQCYVVTCGNGTGGSYQRYYPTGSMPINTTDIQFSSRAYQLQNLSYWDNGGGTDAQFNIKELITAELASSSVTLVEPADTSVVGYKNVTFNCFANFTTGITNVTLWIDQKANLSVENSTANENVSLTTNQNVSLGSHNWTCSAVDSSASQKFATNYSFTRAAITENSRSFNATSYETLVEGYYLNLSSDGAAVMTADLWFNGTKYSTTKVGNDSNAVFNASIAQPISITGNKSLFWSMMYGTDNTNTSISNQTVKKILFNLCNASLNVSYINFTFADEINASAIHEQLNFMTAVYYIGNGSYVKTLSFSNATVNPSYAFCAEPVDRNMTLDLYVPYFTTGYPQRVYTTNKSYNNVTTNVTLYSLSSVDGQYVTFQVINAGLQALQGTIINATTASSGLVAQGITDAAGLATFFLNPTVLHTINAFKTGYPFFSTSIYPTQTSYTITLNSQVTSNITDYSNGVSAATYLPQSNYLINDTSYPFNMSITSSYYSFDVWGFNITDDKNNIVATASSVAAAGGVLNTALNTKRNESLIMHGYWIINGSYITDAPKQYIVWNDADSGWSIKKIGEDLSSYMNTGFFGLKKGFGLNLIIFVIIFGVTGILSWKFALNSPAAIAMIAFVLTAFFDVGLGLIQNFAGSTINFATIFMGIILAALLIKEGTGY